MNTSSKPVTKPQDDQETAARLAAVLDTVVDGVITIDEYGIINSVNPAVERMFGYSEDELVGKNVSLLMPSPHSEEHDGYLENYRRTGIAKIIGIGRELEARRKDGTIFPIDLAVSEVKFDDTRMFSGVIRDMTDRKQAEAQLEEERDFSDSLLQLAHAIVLVLDEQGRIVQFNPFLERLSGYSLAEVRGKNWFETFLPERVRAETRSLFYTTVGGIPVKGHVNAVLDRNGREHQIAWSGRRLKTPSGEVRGVLAIGNDVTQLRAAEQRLVQSERLAAIGQMVTGLAHESRNALQRARACLEMLELDLEDRPELMDLTTRAARALDELQRLYEEVRSYAAPLKLDLRECVLSEIWTETWDHLGEARDGKDVRLRAECDSVSLKVQADRGRIAQVFRNILENAVAACPASGEVVITTLDAELHGQPAIELRFRDNGPGLSEDTKQRVFEPFFTTKSRGTGLGMAIARRIVDAHGGEISIADLDEPGATIVVVLPRSMASSR
ncbi:Sensor protein FixL [Maioricimonas rarisocia]|uniref:Sensor protein FixL n=1 Tax=Maioricimonas rarisocia TaxID=2528026 RepID=A0A517ZC15_9PLAN|nr:PAS domain-containing sensor histidine kinase [Maioricimonas rarisocia]QDU39991.1 Sensor protein FixL [Maioricimonas rarisocia]